MDPNCRAWWRKVYEEDKSIQQRVEGGGGKLKINEKRRTTHKKHRTRGTVTEAKRTNTSVRKKSDKEGVQVEKHWWNVIDQTNLFTVHKQRWSVNKTAIEIEQVLGMCMFMDLVQISTVRAYWEVNKVSQSCWCDVERLTWEIADTAPLSKQPQRVWRCKERLNEETHKMAQKAVRIMPLCTWRTSCCWWHYSYFQGHNLSWKSACQQKHHGVEREFKMRGCGSGFLYDFEVCQGPADPGKEWSDVGLVKMVFSNWNLKKNTFNFPLCSMQNSMSISAETGTGAFFVLVT